MPELVPTPIANNAPPPPSSTPPGTNTGAPTAPAEWRAPANAPSWARGKTPEEILGIADTLVNAYREPPAPAAPAAPLAPTIADDDYITGAQLRAWSAAASTPNDVAVNLAADANLSIVRGQYATDFTRYGHEIDAKLASVPKHLRTIDNIRTVVNMVRSDHLDEIAHERAQQIVSGMEPALRSTGAAGAPPPIQREHSLESDKIPAEWKRRAEAAGITERVVDEFCRANDMTSEAFYKQFDTPMNRIVEDVAHRRQA